MAALDTLLDWISINSVTGGEADYGNALIAHLEALGLGAERQELSPGRFNVLARAAEPLVVMCTHLDTVPPFFGPSRQGKTIQGRGSCDAKGPALAMIEAVRRVLKCGEERVGFLFTVGEETDGIGAQHANAQLAAPWAPRYTIVGEPTDNRFIKGGKGVYQCKLHGKGVAGHSSEPLGPSAIHELVGAMQRMLSDEWGNSEVFGRGSINFGMIEGGLAGNVVAPQATATVLIRAVEDPRLITKRILTHLGEHVELELKKNYGPVEFALPDGEDGPVVSFGTDAPFLGKWGQPLLYGPGSIRDAHTAHEKLDVDSFEQAIVDYERVILELLARVDAGAKA